MIMATLEKKGGFAFPDCGRLYERPYMGGYTVRVHYHTLSRTAVTHTKW